ncbi:MAG: hypothetical protein KJZ93_28560 [Caldilineaceae bacterium]|nr:hypothetical protein [Caldilineaceae bacterium]
MTTKELGFVELEWTCPRCNTRNPGTQTTCSGCGAPQPDNVQFEAAAAGQLLQDTEKIARAQAGPDVHCPYCGARNAATAATCRQCGGALDEGARREAGNVVGAFHAGPPPDIVCATCGAANPGTATTCQRCGAPLARPKPVASSPATPKASRSGGSWLIVGIVGLVVGALALFAILSMRTTEMVGVVREARWVRSVPIEGLVPVQHTAWWDQLPQDAAGVSCQPALRRTQDTPADNAREVCGTPYVVDTGTGVGRVVQDCRYEIYEDRCSYTVDEWRVVDTLEQRGTGFAPEWPVAALQPRQRLGRGSERYQCIVSAGEQSFTYQPRALEEYLQCQPGSEWRLEVNSFGALNSIQPLP